MPSRDFKRRLKRRLAYRKFREMYPEKARERNRLSYERQLEKLAREREEARRLRPDLKAADKPREKLAKRPLRNERKQVRRRREITSQRRRWQQNNDDNLSAAAGHFLEYWTRKEKKKLCLQISAIRQRAKKINKPAAGESPAGSSSRSRRFVDRQMRGSSSPQFTICSSRGGKFYRDNSCQTTVSYKNKVYDDHQQRPKLTSPRFRCAVVGCKVELSSSDRGVALFPFPCPLRDADRRDEWLRRLGLTESRVCSPSSRVCRRHFHDKYVHRSKRNRNTFTLGSDAVPVPAVMTLGSGGGAEDQQIERSTNTEEQGDDGAESGFSVPEQSNAEELCSKFTTKHELEDVKIGGRRSVATSVQLPSVQDDDKSESGDDHRRNVSGGFEAAISVKEGNEEEEEEDDDGEAYSTTSPPAVVSSSNLVPIGKQNQRPRHLCSDDRSIDMTTMKPEEEVEIAVKEEQGEEMRQDSPILIRSVEHNSGGMF